MENTPPAATSHWRGWQEIRADLRFAVALVAGFAVVGVPAGLLWVWLAPRADFRITSSGPVVIGSPSSELFIADDAVFTLIVVAIGLLGGAAAWLLRRRRGLATLFALAVGLSGTAVVAWQLGELLGHGPTEAQLRHVGEGVTTALTLQSLPALALAPAAALLAYLTAVLFCSRDDLGRVDDPPPPARASDEFPRPAEISSPSSA